MFKKKKGMYVTKKDGKNIGREGSLLKIQHEELYRLIPQQNNQRCENYLKKCKVFGNNASGIQKMKKWHTQENPLKFCNNSESLWHLIHDPLPHYLYPSSA